MERDYNNCKYGYHYSISTHTLTWSVTFGVQVVLNCMNYFNSHAHVERDRSPSFDLLNTSISTHTLTWSVTCTSLGILANNGIISTHTLTWSVTIVMYIVLGAIEISTHTLTWSVTHCTFSTQAVTWNFNSHAHVERDLLYVATSPLSKDFNSHAHVERD